MHPSHPFDPASLNPLVASLADALLQRQWRVATAESCTGGWVSQELTALPGSSRWFECGYVTYSNAAKQRLLGVSPDVLHTHGAVSEAVAEAMAAGAASEAGVPCALSITGVAGPGGGSDDKPVGTVCFGWSVNGRVSSQRCQFDGDRKSVRGQSVHCAISGLLDRLV